MLNGHTVFVETKAGGGAPRKLQQVQIKRINDAGGTALVISTREGVDDLIRTLI